MNINITLKKNERNNITGEMVSKKGNIRINGFDSLGNIRILVRSLSKELYEYFPFMVEFHVNGTAVSVVEVTKENEYHEVILAISCQRPFHDIEIYSEIAGVPLRKGINNDVREISIELLQIYFEELDNPITRSNFKCKREHTLTRTLFDQDIRINPIFVIGAYRSMTSITTWLLGQHPNVAPMEETNWLTMLYLGSAAAFEQAQKAQDGASEVYNIARADFLRWQGWAIDKLHSELADNRVQMVQNARLAGMADRYDARFAVRRSPFSPKQRWVDGTPENTGIAIGLGEMFEGAQFVFMLRDPIQVVSSLMLHGNAGGVNRSVDEAVDVWERMTQWGYEAFETLGPDRVIIQACDKLIDDSAKSISSLFAFLDEPQYDQACVVLSEQINSSHSDHGISASALPALESARLREIRNGILEGRPLSSLPWRRPLWRFEERRFSMIASLRQTIS
jgi:hypothetical protein